MSADNFLQENFISWMLKVVGWSEKGNLLMKKKGRRTVRTKRITRRINLMGIITGAIFSRRNVEESRQPPSVILICAAASNHERRKKNGPCSIIKDGSHRLRPGISRREKTSIIQKRARLVTSIDPSGWESASGIINAKQKEAGSEGEEESRWRDSRRREFKPRTWEWIYLVKLRALSHRHCVPGLPRFVPDAREGKRKRDRAA